MEQLKVDVINDAYSKIRVSGLTVEPSPSDLELALQRLESMMSELDGARGISINYNFEDDPDPNSFTNVPRFASEMMSSLLATRLIPDFNKAVPMQLSMMTSASLSAVSGKVARDKMNRIQYPSRMPVGSGNRIFPRWGRFYYPVPIPPIDSIRMLVGETNSYNTSFEQYLNDGESIDSISTLASSGITLNSATIIGNVVNFSITATLPSLRTLKITVTTSDGRVDVRVISIDVNRPEVA